MTRSACGLVGAGFVVAAGGADTEIPIAGTAASRTMRHLRPMISALHHLTAKDLPIPAQIGVTVGVAHTSFEQNNKSQRLF